VLALVLSVALVLVDERSSWLQPLRQGLNLVTAPIHYTAHWPQDAGDWLQEQLRTREDLQQENARLERRVLILEQKAQRLAVLKAENVRLRELLNSSERVDEQVRVAEVIGSDPDPNRRELVINQGSVGGDVYQGQAVLDSQGLIGQVVEVGPMSSRVLLITDANHALSVKVNRNGVRSILAGTGRGDELAMRYVPETADVREGDLLVSTGLGGRYPGGYPVADITSVTHKPGQAFLTIEARPRGRLGRLSHVLLVRRSETQGQQQSEVGDAE
jgi:rod shape-determining protein MreC